MELLHSFRNYYKTGKLNDLYSLSENEKKAIDLFYPHQKH